MVNFEVGLCT